MAGAGTRRYGTTQCTCRRAHSKTNVGISFWCVCVRVLLCRSSRNEGEPKPLYDLEVLATEQDGGADEADGDSPPEFLFEDSSTDFVQDSSDFSVR